LLPELIRIHLEGLIPTGVLFRSTVLPSAWCTGSLFVSSFIKISPRNVADQSYRSDRSSTNSGMNKHPFTIILIMYASSVVHWLAGLVPFF
jgi:hypothetical protein